MVIVNHEKRKQRTKNQLLMILKKKREIKPSIPSIYDRKMKRFIHDEIPGKTLTANS